MASGATEWIPTTGGDIAALFLGGAVFTFITLTLMFLWCNKNWTPLKTIRLGLISLNALGGLLWWISFIFSFGVIQRPDGLEDCTTFDFALSAAGVSLFYSSYTVRHYRNYKVFVKYNPDMWATSAQMVVLTIPSLALYAYTYLNDVGTFRPETQGCRGDDVLNYALTGWVAVIAIINIYLAVAMRNVRVQFNEFRSQLVQVITVIAFLIIFTVANVIVFDTISAVLGRIIITATGALVPLIMFWTVIPFAKALYTKDKKFANKYKSMFKHAAISDLFAEDADIEQQLTEPRLRALFKDYSAKTYNVENVEFFEQTLLLEDITDFHKRQAKVMEIINVYIMPNVPKAVNIPGQMRDRILRSPNIMEPSLFDEAKREVLQLIQQGVAPGLKKTEKYQRIKEKVESDAKDYEVAGQAGVVPDKVAKRVEDQKDQIRAASNVRGGSLSRAQGTAAAAAAARGTPPLAVVRPPEPVSAPPTPDTDAVAPPDRNEHNENPGFSPTPPSPSPAEPLLGVGSGSPEAPSHPPPRRSPSRSPRRSPSAPPTRPPPRSPSKSRPSPSASRPNNPPPADLSHEGEVHLGDNLPPAPTRNPDEDDAPPDAPPPPSDA